MLSYTHPPHQLLEVQGRSLACYPPGPEDNLDPVTVASFGAEWTKFSAFEEADVRTAGDQYFDIVDWSSLPEGATALDAGCGTGRWTRYVAPHVGFVEAVDPSAAALSALAYTQDLPNVRVTQAGIDNLPFAEQSFDFILCLGVLHHIPDTAGALRTLVRHLKPGGTLLLYLYYALETRGPLYRLLFRLSAGVRAVVSRLPRGLKALASDLIAFLVYVPLVGLATLAKTLLPGQAWRKLPLSYYVGKSQRIIRNDALDRFGTPLEQRFTQQQMREMMQAAGLEAIRFSEGEPYWHATGRKAPQA